MQTFLSNQPRLSDKATSLGPIWPMPLPYPEVFGRELAFRSTWKKRRVALTVLVFNWLYLGRPGVCPGVLWLGQPLTSRQWRRVRTLEDLSEDANALTEVDAQMMARAALKTEASSDVLDALHRALLDSSLCGGGPYYAARGKSSVCENGVGGSEDVSFSMMRQRFVGPLAL